MGRTTVVIAAIAIVVSLGVLALTTISTSRCVSKARSILDQADPLDRDPPQRVADTIKLRVQEHRLQDVLAGVLLDKMACTNRWSGADWLIDRPALSWRLGFELNARELVSLYASTADVGQGPQGLNRAALGAFGMPISELRDDQIDCLVQRSKGVTWPYALGCGPKGPPAVPRTH